MSDLRNAPFKVDIEGREYVVRISSDGLLSGYPAPPPPPPVQTPKPAAGAEPEGAE